MLDDSDDVDFWVRLQRNDLPILWSSAGSEYNPDFLVVEKSGAHIIVETKMDKEMSSEDVLGKRQAAQRWANHVNADDKIAADWRYLLVSQTDVGIAKGSWSALKGLGL